MRAPVPLLLSGPCCGRGRRARPGTGAAAGGRPGIAPEPGCLPVDPKRPRNGACRQSCGSCCRLGKGCRKTPNSPATTQGRGGRSDGALHIPRPGARGHAIRPRPQSRTGENMIPPALLLILGIETKSPFLHRASGLPPGHRVRVAAGCGRRRCWGAAGPRGPATCLPELAVWLLSSCPGARARGCRWTLWGSESTSRKVGWV